jgi:hypothetical protein
MLKVTSPSAWRRNGPADNCSLALTLGAAANVSVWADMEPAAATTDWSILWSPDRASAPAVEGRFLFLHGRAMAEMVLPVNHGGMLSIHAPRPPKQLVFRATAFSWASQLWDDVFPGGEKEAVGAFLGAPASTFDRVSERLEAFDVDGATNELALALLGSPDADTLKAARHLMITLAKRPFDRNVNFGALACSLISADS